MLGMKTIGFVGLFHFFLMAQVTNFTPSFDDTITTVLFDDTAVMLQSAIYDMNERQRAAAYNIANASTPGFRPIRFPDEIAESIRLYGTDAILNEVNIDDEMVKSTKIRLRHSAYIKLLSTKMDITKKVITMGKGS